MSVLDHANNTLVQGHLYAVAGDQHNHYGGSTAGEKMATLQGFDMLYLHYSTAALFDAIAHSNQPKCLKGTRVAIIKEILAQLQGKVRFGSILWLKGPAGAGKSALEYTIAAICKTKGLLIGGFAFSRTAANRGDGNTLIPTLAVQLSRAVPETKVLIENALKDNQDIFERSREAQLRLLIVDPLRKLWAKTRLRDSFRHRWRYPTIIAIDGLDECSNRDIQCDIIESIGAIVWDLDFPLRFFIASRPEAHISRTFDKIQSDSQVRLSYIYLGEDAAATRDIQTYLETMFKEIRKSHPHLPETWPSSRVILELVEKASGQFIYVSTVMAYIASVGARPDACLQVILQLSRPPIGDEPFSQLDLLYSHILSSVTIADQAATFQILGCLILPERYYTHSNDRLVRKFNTPIILEALFGFERGDVRRHMTDLLSVVSIESDDQPMKVLHASLGDFLLDESRSREHFVDPDKFCKILARKCIDYISGFKSAIFDFNNVDLFIIPSVPLCMGAGLSDELCAILRCMDIPSAFSLVYSSPALFIPIDKTLSDLESCLGRTLPIRDTRFWSRYNCSLQQTHSKNTASSNIIFFILTGKWRNIKWVVREISAEKIKLPDPPIAGSVCFRSPREADDPEIVMVLVPTRPNIPDFVARMLDKRLVESEYSLNNIHAMYRILVDSIVCVGQDGAWRSLWLGSKALY